MDTDMTPDIHKQIEEANIIFDEGKHFDKQARKARHAVEFVMHTTGCKICFRVLIRNGGIQTLEEFQNWTHKSRDVQCEKFGHSKWMQDNLYVLN